MSSTSWKLLGRKQGGNMKNNRNVKSNQSLIIMVIGILCIVMMI